MATTGHLDADIDTSKLIEAEKENGLVELGPENFGGEELQRLAVDLDEALALHTARDGCNIPSVSKIPLVQKLNRDAYP